MKLIFAILFLIPILLLSSYPVDAAKKPARNASLPASQAQRGSLGASVAGGPTSTPKKSSTSVKKQIKKVKTKKSKPAKKTTTPKKSTAKTSGNAKITGSNVDVSYKVQGNSLVVTFSNLKNVASISYTLIYTTNDQQEGAIGTVIPKGANTASRTLLFGTCSKNVCRYHTNISDVTLEVSAKIKSGKTVSKTYYIPY